LGLPAGSGSTIAPPGPERSDKDCLSSRRMASRSRDFAVRNEELNERPGVWPSPRPSLINQWTSFNAATALQLSPCTASRCLNEGCFSPNSLQLPVVLRAHGKPMPSRAQSKMVSTPSGESRPNDECAGFSR
jgi:hypothetical protein